MYLLGVLVAVLCAAAGTAHAQSTSGIAGFDDGFFIQSQNGDHRLVFGGVVQEDGRFSVDEPLPITNTFTLRKLRPILTGRVARYFDVRLMPDFGNGATTLLDAWLDVRFSRALRLRLGKDKTPVGHELLQGDAFLLFPERALASSLVPNRDVGIEAHGDLGGGRVTYSGGLFNGVPDGVSAGGQGDSNNDKDAAGFIAVRPFRTPAGMGVLDGFGIHVGGSIGRESGPLPAFRTSAGQTYFSYVPATAASGRRRRMTPAVFYYHKAFGGFAEYVRSAQEVVRGGVEQAVANHAWAVTASYVLTGEATSDRGVRPRAPFDPRARHWGALQIAARFSELTVDDDVFVSGFAAPGASSGARQWTVGVNWYPVQWVKWYATFERTTFNESPVAARPAEDVILFRFQLAF